MAFIYTLLLFWAEFKLASVIFTDVFPPIVFTLTVPPTAAVPAPPAVTRSDFTVWVAELSITNPCFFSSTLSLESCAIRFAVSSSKISSIIESSFTLLFTDIVSVVSPLAATSALSTTTLVSPEIWFTLAEAPTAAAPPPAAVPA